MTQSDLNRLRAESQAGTAAAEQQSRANNATATAEALAQQHALETPLGQAVQAAEGWMLGVDGIVRDVWSPLPDVRYVDLGKVLTVNRAGGWCTVALTSDTGAPPPARHVRIGAGTPQVGKTYPVFQPYQMPRDPHVSLLQGPEPAGDPWLHAPGGQKLFYAVGHLSLYPNYEPQGPTLSVMALDWPLPTETAALATNAQPAGSFDFTTEAHSYLTPGGGILGPARFLGVDGLGNVWATQAIRYDPGQPFGHADPFGAFPGEAGNWTNPATYRAWVARIPAYGAGTPAAHVQCPDNVIPRAVDPTGGHLLAVSEAFKREQTRRDTREHITPPPHRTTTYDWTFFGNIATVDHYAVDVATVTAEGAVTWQRNVGQFAGEGRWINYLTETGPSEGVVWDRFDLAYWPETFREPITPGFLLGFHERQNFAYRPPGDPLLHSIWTETVAGSPVLRWRAAAQAYPGAETKDGPTALFTDTVTTLTLHLDGTDHPPALPVDTWVNGYPYKQELLERARWPMHLREDHAERMHVADGLPYMVWGAGPDPSGGEWVILTYLPSRLLADTHDTTDLRANLVTKRSTTGMAGAFLPFPQGAQFRLARIIAHSVDGQNILAEDQNGTYDPDTQTLSAGRLWQTTDGGATWTLLPYRITALPAPTGLAPLGYGFIVDVS